MSNLPNSEPNLEQDVKYFTEKRDDVLEHLNDGIKMNLSDDIIQQRLTSVLRTNKQLKLIEDVLIVSRITGNNKKK